MFDGITVSAIIAQATPFAAAVSGVVLIVIGLGLFYSLANWIIGKFRSR
jgi:xanthine/uracil permease